MKEDLLIDLDLPPATSRAMAGKPAANQNLSLLDEPIDVPEVGKFFVLL